MGGRALLRALVCAALLSIGATRVDAQNATCATGVDQCVPGGGATSSDCIVEWRLSAAPPLAGNGIPTRKLVCYEGDGRCDADPDIGNGRCDVPLTLCINSSDPRLTTCIASDVATVEVRKPAAGSTRDAADDANLAALEGMASGDFGVAVLRDGQPFMAGMPNAMPDLCGAPALIAVPLRRRRSGALLKGKRALRLESGTSDGRTDIDVLKLECRPSTCGNGAVEPHEDCDDGNRANGDGCDQGCRLEPATPTPTATPLPANTSTATGTRTATATRTPPATSTATRTGSATFTASSTPTATATRTPTATATPPSSATATATVSATATATRTYTPTATATVPAVQMSIVAYRPQSEIYGSPFQRREVPDTENLVPGVGVRINGDDDDGNGLPDMVDSPVVNENDLIELRLNVNPTTPPEGYEYVLRRSNPGVRIWDDAIKGFALLDSNDELALTFSGPSRSVWAERFDHGVTLVEVVARPIGGGPSAAAGQVNLVSFTSIVVALGGENQSPSDPPSSNHGMFNIASTLYGLGYDVHMYDEDNVTSSGTGIVYDEVVRAVRDRGIGLVAIFGYSHGGGATHALAGLLDANRGGIGTFAFPYTAYVDAIRNSSNIDITSETRLPAATAYHVNYYQRNDLFIKGNSVAGADVDVNVGSTPWGADLDHGAIDDHPNVRDGVLQPLLARVPR